jgi:hypothetical protein
MGMPGEFVQSNYQIYEEGSESGSTPLAAVNTEANVDVDTNFQVRVQIDEISTTADDMETPVWEYELNTSTVWNDITGSSSVIQAAASTPLTATDTADRLTTGIITPNSWVDESDGAIPTLTYAGDDSCEALLSCQIIGADVSNGDQILVRLSGTPTIAYTVTADINVVKVGGARRRSNVT